MITNPTSTTTLEVIDQIPDDNYGYIAHDNGWAEPIIDYFVQGDLIYFITPYAQYFSIMDKDGRYNLQRVGENGIDMSETADLFFYDRSDLS